ncbi:probable prolyl 4-hydroxylase 9 [Andrographis paniculata]|uniref:probable prolyl 4-hydroxylase 9 n=1 Tax=Andrographis paniculata TaxID=175694 RepID=UPI0021E85053|nr:probable prolyl 4-hydroxylase 9 [Andrographis paniculata]
MRLRFCSWWDARPRKCRGLSRLLKMQDGTRRTRRNCKEMPSDSHRKIMDEEMRRDLEAQPQEHGVSGEGYVGTIPFQILSWRPRALYFPYFASALQCQSIINMTKFRLKPSKVALSPGYTYENTKRIRTSSGMFISAYEDKTRILDQIEEKIARATMIPRTHGEAFNVLRYEIGQLYELHHDSFDPNIFGSQKSQRVASFLLYLSDVEEGGETVFPFENGNINPKYDFRQCTGLKVKPRRGDGLLFYSLFPNGTLDPTSLHGSCPVIRGQKWVATKWIGVNVQDDDSR